MKPLVRMMLPAFGLLALLASALPAHAGTTALDAGGGCYGLGDSWIYSSSLTEARTNGCASSDRYIEAVTWYVGGGSGLCGGDWAAADRLCRDTNNVSSVQTLHNLCFAWCAGWKHTSDA